MEKVIEFKSDVLPYALGSHRGELSVKLGDIYNTGNIQFSIRVRTEAKDCNDRWHEESWGFNGSFILEHFKDLFQYLWLHGNNFDGSPRYPVAEGAYLLRHNRKREACKLLRLDSEEVDMLMVPAHDPEYFSYMLHKIGRVDFWKESAEGLIKWLEEHTGETIDRDFGTSRSDIHTVEGKLDQMKQLEAEGYYDDENVMARFDEQYTAAIDNVRQEVNDQFVSQMRRLETERDVRLSILEAGITSSNIIIYEHDKSVNFNWSYSHPLIPESDIEKYVETIGRVRFPDMKFKNEHMGCTSDITRFQL